MCLTDKRLWILFIPIIMIFCNGSSKGVNADSDAAIAPAVFSVEKISREEFIQADSTSGDYNIYPRRVDSIAQHDVLNKIFQDARERMADLDSVDRCAIYEAVTDDELYRADNLLYYPDLKLLGFKVPMDYHNNTVWWYDSATGEPTIGTLFEPTAVNKNGLYVCQVLDDCDMMLDLRFFRKQGNLIYEIQAYRNNGYSGEHCLFVSEEERFKPIFWHKDNLLYLRSYDISHGEIVYLKILLN